ncbi:MAG: GxxExxY protein [Hyphomicrobiales bacterium]
MNKQELDTLIKIIFESAREVHQHLGKGLLASVYKSVLAYEIENKGLKVEVNKPVHILYKGKPLKEYLKCELYIQDEVAIEIITDTSIKDRHLEHLNSILRFSKKENGLLINFNVSSISGGFHKVYNQKL